jgi:hypothetical protein
VRGGLLVHHGYKRPGYGHIVGDCFGVDRPPHETSDDCARAYLQLVVTPHVEAAERRSAYLGNDPYQPSKLSFPQKDPATTARGPDHYVGSSGHSWWKISPHTRERLLTPMTLEELIALRIEELLPTYSYSTETSAEKTSWIVLDAKKEWKEALRRARRIAEADLTEWRSEQRRVQGLVDSWQLLPLLSVDEEVAGKRASQAARAAQKAEEIQGKLDEALASFRKRLDAAVKNRNANTVSDLFANGYRKYMDISSRPGAPGGTQRRPGVLKLVDRDSVWRAFGLIDSAGNYLEPNAISDAMLPWSTYRFSRSDLSKWDPFNKRLPPEPWPESLGGGTTKTPA